MGEVTCRRCGLCCHIVLEGRISNKPCRFMMPVGNNRYICKIYQVDNRIGHDIGDGNKCHKRESVHLNYIGCPYNRNEWGRDLGIGDGIDEGKEE
jgi:hypothetical protein